MKTIQTTKRISVPGWLAEETEAASARKFDSDDERMRFVIKLLSANIEQQTGGPFAAAIFSSAGELISTGVNLVPSSNCSLLHAEIVALLLAEERLRSFSIRTALAKENLPSASSDSQALIYSSCAPCIQCFGAIWWAGLDELVYAAPASAAIELGFNEGPLPLAWEKLLYSQMRTRVRSGVLSAESSAAMQAYSGPIYNG
jgi:tRNA(Arg) A34 adenosine deaminase TadA